MNLPKHSQNKNEEDVQQSDKAQKSEATKKAVQKPVKVKKAEPAKKPARKPEESKMALLHRFRQYLREVAHELRKVVWPSRKETIGSTAVVLVIVIISGIYLGFVDAILSRLVRMLVG